MRPHRIYVFWMGWNSKILWFHHCGLCPESARSARSAIGWNLKSIEIEVALLVGESFRIGCNFAFEFNQPRIFSRHSFILSVVGKRQRNRYFCLGGTFLGGLWRALGFPWEPVVVCCSEKLSAQKLPQDLPAPGHVWLAITPNIAPCKCRQKRQRGRRGSSWCLWCCPHFPILLNGGSMNIPLVIQILSFIYRPSSSTFIVLDFRCFPALATHGVMDQLWNNMFRLNIHNNQLFLCEQPGRILTW